MSSTVVLCALALVATLASLLTSVAAVQPTVPLSQMEPDHACLFICNICFPEQEDSVKLMDCSNRVCGPVMTGNCAMEKFIWLGHHCRHYSSVERMWSSSGKR